jgi:uncharacterized protein (TIGR00106 family)
MIAEFSIVPLGAGSSIGREISGALRLVDESGLPYKLNPMGTVVEGGWEEVMALIRKCHATVLGNNDRVITTIRIDDRKGRTDMLESKTLSVEEKLGRRLRK